MVGYMVQLTIGLLSSVLLLLLIHENDIFSLCRYSYSLIQDYVASGLTRWIVFSSRGQLMVAAG